MISYAGKGHIPWLLEKFCIENRIVERYAVPGENDGTAWMMRLQSGQWHYVCLSPIEGEGQRILFDDHHSFGGMTGEAAFLMWKVAVNQDRINDLRRVLANLEEYDKELQRALRRLYDSPASLSRAASSF